MKIGFVGQGFVGKAYADNYEARGYDVVRYSLDAGNKEAIRECSIVFIAVPTPTLRGIFCASIVEEALGLVRDGSVAVIKSTVRPGTTRLFQQTFPKISVLHSPEFLRQEHADADVASPARNIVGIVGDRRKADALHVMRTLPSSPIEIICEAETAELAKYASNAFLAMKVVFANAIYDVAQGFDVDYAKLAACIGSDPRIGKSHLNVLEKDGRGAGGPCLLKDLATLTAICDDMGWYGNDFFSAVQRFNLLLLRQSGKDSERIREIFGE